MVEFVVIKLKNGVRNLVFVVLPECLGQNIGRKVILMLSGMAPPRQFLMPAEP